MAREMVTFTPRGSLVYCRDVDTGDLWVINPGWEDLEAKMRSMEMPLRVQSEVYLYLDMPLSSLRVALRGSFEAFFDEIRSGLSKKERK